MSENSSSLTISGTAGCSEWPNGDGTNFLRYSYVTSVAPNCGLERSTRASEPLNSAERPSFERIWTKQSLMPLYVAWPLRAST